MQNRLQLDIKILLGLAIALLLFASGDWPNAYYAFLRCFISGLALFLAVYSYRTPSLLPYHSIPLILVGVLYNPIYPVEFGTMGHGRYFIFRGELVFAKDAWKFFNTVTALYLLALLIVLCRGRSRKVIGVIMVCLIVGPPVLDGLNDLYNRHALLERQKKAEQQSQRQRKPPLQPHIKKSDSILVSREGGKTEIKILGGTYNDLAEHSIDWNQFESLRPKPRSVSVQSERKFHLDIERLKRELAAEKEQKNAASPR